MKKREMRNQHKPLVSVIMPVYNAGRFLVDAIDSVRSQTIEDWELLAIDDTSTDDSLKILKAYASRDKRIKVYRNKSHKMIGASLNMLLKKVRGRFIARMDADDVSLPHRFEIQLAYLKSHRGIAVCGGSVEMIDARGRVFAEKRFPTDHATLYNLIMRMVPVQHPTFMTRARIMKKCRYDETMTTAEDVDMLFQLMQKGKLANVSEFVYQYRKSQTSNGYHNVKKTFYLTLMCRLKGIVNYGYRPSLSGLVQTGLETIIVTLLPSKWVVKMYEWYRFKRTVSRSEKWIRGLFSAWQPTRKPLAVKLAQS